MNDIFTEDIKKRLLPLSDKARILFAVLICERLYPNYVFFQNLVHWGNHDILQDAISVIRQYLFKDDLFSKEDIEDVMERIDLVTPDTEDFVGITTSFALDACTSIYGTLSYILDKNIDHVVDVASVALDTVDMFIQEKDDLNANDRDIEMKIANDPFMIAEKAGQRELLQKLSGLKFDRVTDEIIESLKNKSSIIDLRLLDL